MLKKLTIILLVLCFSNIILGNPYNFGHIDYSDGLSHNSVLSFGEDNNGFLWIGTNSGLNRYDGYTFKIFKNNPDDPNSLPDNTVKSIIKDQLGRFWIGLPNQFCLFNPDNEKFSNDVEFVCEGVVYQLYNIDLVVPFGDSTLFLRVPEIGIIEHNLITEENKLLSADSKDGLVLYSNNIFHFTVFGRYLYVTYSDGFIEKIDVKKQQVINSISDIKNMLNADVRQYETFVDSAQNLWLYSNDVALGLFKFDSLGKMQEFNMQTKPALNSNLISSIIQDSEGKIWIGTDHGGINILSKDLSEVDYEVHNEYNENSISQNAITRLFLSNDYIIWIGTFKQGVNFYHEDLFRFLHYANQPNDANSLPYNDVNCFAEDASGNIWIGTNGEGLIYFDRKKNSFSKIILNPENIQSNVIVSLLIDKNDKLWIGTYHGGLFYYDGKTFTNYLHNPTDANSIASNKVWELFEDSQGNIWIGMLGGGLDLFNPIEKRFYHYSGTGINSLNANFVMDIREDNNGNIWFGTDIGTFVLDHATLRFIHYSHDAKNDSSLSSNIVYKIFKDSKSNMWLGTRNGLNLFEKSNNNFFRFTENNGLPDNSIMSMLESNSGDLWLGTSNGLSRLTVTYDEKGKYQGHYTVNYTESDGLQGREFNEGSALKTRDGELIFGGANGFNLFLPKNENTKARKNKTHIYGLEFFGNELTPETDKQISNLPYSALLDGETIKLNFKENMFTLKFVNIDFLSPKKINYRYKLEGFNDKWIYTNWDDRKATFTNLNPGNYRFIVQSSDNSTYSEDTQSQFDIIITPPWYNTWVAYLIYFVLIVVIMLVLRRVVLNKERNRNLKEEAIKESERQHELNLLKTRFFTNISHEFRTPLTLVLTPLQQLLKSDNDIGVKKQLDLINQNANRLLTLVNQLLDFRKAEANKLSLVPIYGDIVKLVSNTVDSFSDFAKSKDIELKFLSYESELYMQFDRDKIEKIISNLLSNAFKFTAAKGSITVITRLTTHEMHEVFEIKVEDKGVGIREEDREKLFERFYQGTVPTEIVTTGSGIGLSLTKDFVELHKGSISVVSKPHVGSTFTVLIPVNRERILSNLNETSETEKLPELVTEGTDENNSQYDEKKKTILLVEDNEEFRGYLKDSFSEKYKILEAENGQKALLLLEEENADLIISDIMMPVMDGIELCNKVKTDTMFSHIPVILLTAKSTQEDKIEGLRHGADEYLTKPFSLDILESRINYLLGLREKFIKAYQKSFRIESEGHGITPVDQKFLNRTLELINTNLSNSDYSVEKLSAELSISRVYLYKKVSSLTGKTPVELIRLVRLKKAAELLLKSQLTISEITYDVGFNDPRYFSKQFKIEYHVTPSEYREQMGP